MKKKAYVFEQSRSGGRLDEKKSLRMARVLASKKSVTLSEIRKAIVTVHDVTESLSIERINRLIEKNLITYTNELVNL